MLPHSYNEEHTEYFEYLDSCIEKYLENIATYKNNLCVLVPIYKGLSFRATFSWNKTDKKLNEGIITFSANDIDNPDPSIELTKSFSLNHESNSYLFQDILNLKSEDLYRYLFVFSPTSGNIQYYHVEGILAIEKASLNNDITDQDYLQYGNNFLYSFNIRKRDIVLKESIQQHILETNTATEDDKLNKLIFDSLQYTNNLKDHLLVINQADCNYLIHFKFVEKLIQMKKFGFNVRMEDIGVCLPYKQCIWNTLYTIFENSKYILHGISLECDTTILDDQSIFLPCRSIDA
jgi:hypothetical protein